MSFDEEEEEDGGDDDDTIAMVSKKKTKCYWQECRQIFILHGCTHPI